MSTAMNTAHTSPSHPRTASTSVLGGMRSSNGHLSDSVIRSRAHSYSSGMTLFSPGKTCDTIGRPPTGFF